MIRGAASVRDAYRDEPLARRYIDERFREPLGALLHARQVRRLESVIATARPRSVLEIAPGPARLTAELAAAFEGTGVLVDTSAQMLAEAKRRLPASRKSQWFLLQADAFHLPFDMRFDLVYTFRLLRHFEAADRRLLYQQIGSVLRPGGLLVFDAVNEIVSAPLRARARPGEYRHYDALFTSNDLRHELESAGFQVVSLEGVQHRYALLSRLQALVAPRSKTLARIAMEIVDCAGGEPLEWIVTCRRA